METRLNRNLGKITHFFITSMLTLVMSTFWLNSGGNLVCRSSFLSTGVAIARRERLREVERRGRNARVEGANMSTARWSVRAYRGRLEYQAMRKAVRSECMGIPILRGRLLVAIRWKSDESYSMENIQKWKLLNMQNVLDSRCLPGAFIQPCPDPCCKWGKEVC